MALQFREVIVFTLQSIALANVMAKGIKIGLIGEYSAGLVFAHLTVKKDGVDNYRVIAMEVRSLGLTTFSTLKPARICLAGAPIEYVKYGFDNDTYNVTLVNNLHKGIKLELDRATKSLERLWFDNSTVQAQVLTSLVIPSVCELEVTIPEDVKPKKKFGIL